MRKRISLLIVLAMFTTALFSGCAKKVVEEDISTGTTEMEEEVVSEEGVVSDTGLQEGTLPVESPLVEGVSPEDELTRMASEEGRLTPVYFDFDQFNIRSDMKPGLNEVARWLKEYDTVKVRVQGHCDERGSNEYNIALGERRANSIKRYLSTLGVASSRLSTVTFGEEKPVCSGHNEGCWWKNRRGETEIVAR